VKAPAFFVAGMHLRWDGVRQRPHHLLTRLGARIPVVVVEEPLAAASDRDEVRTAGGVHVIRPLRTRGWGEPFVDAQALATARAITGGTACGVWLYTPMMDELVDAFGAAPLVYDVMDELAAFDFAPAGIAERERAVLERADVVFTGGPTLYEHRKSYGPKVHAHPSGVEFERFAADVGPHPIVSALGGTCVAYVGVIDERLDYEIIAALADALPDGHVILAGPVVKVDPARLPHRKNVHYTGRLSYAALPSLLAGVDVALMPFALNRATASISPTKTLEYFAARRPVVSTPVHDVVALYGDVAYIAAGADAFVAAVREALDAPAERIERGVALAREHAWDAIFAKMWAEISRSWCRGGRANGVGGAQPGAERP
jgi:UDP-galactopyranose mutase